MVDSGAIQTKAWQHTQSVLFKIASLINRELDLDDFYRHIHLLVGELMPADNLYIAVHEPASHTISFPYYVDQNNVRPEPRLLEQVKDVESCRPTDYVFRTGKPKLLLEDQQVGLGDIYDFDAGSFSKAWLGAPLKNERRETFGVIAVQIYEGDDIYGEQERDLLVYASQHISAVLEIKWKSLALARANRELREANETLEAKVAERTARLEQAMTSLAEKHELLKESQEQMLEQAHAAGMADIASSVLHNIGNILNNAFVAATHLRETPTQQWLSSIQKLVDFIETTKLLNHDHPKYAAAMGYFKELIGAMTEGQQRIDMEISDLNEALRLMRQLTESQITLAQTEGFFTQTSQKQIVTKVMAVFSTRIESLSATVETQFADETVEQLPAYTIKRALSYIIENALDAITGIKKPKLTLSMTRHPGGTCLIIEDNGRGVDAEHLESVCKLGFSTKGRHGFGLHYACNAMATVDARLRFESEPHKGTRVTLTFPNYKD